MFDGVLDDLVLPEQPGVDVPALPEPIEPEPEPQAWEPEPEIETAPELVAIDEPEIETAPELVAIDEPEPVADKVVTPQAEVETDTASVIEKFETQCSIDPFQSHDEALDALVADIQASPEPEKRVVLVHRPEDKARLEERLVDTPTDVRVVTTATTPRKSRAPLLVGVGLAVLALGAIGWWTLSSNKESPEPAASTVEPAAQPAVAEPSTPDIQVPTTPEPVVINPADLVADVIQTTPEPAPVQPEPPVVEPEVAPAPVVAKAAPAQPSAPKPKAKPATPKPKPQPKPAEKTWQDDALDQLDNLEKRL
ncbi:hypothetical protein CSC65_05915 [Pseudoxanthomonas daejeonensis]|uniref:Uncharacterized protein n=2 Tax=Pseudoxanthomonas daejeonensis TaxID=266062 RepID=A0ABQ6Z987_9GAMM|nr:hypothetical protein CSC65_05915 [Pseudoxanthomonas daejeonensis]